MGGVEGVHYFGAEEVRSLVHSAHGKKAVDGALVGERFEQVGSLGLCAGDGVSEKGGDEIGGTD
jgi:hypothetical protein